mmetsp:Transcript_4098/g.2375  ORF Transcript_4098/g.2375 Transcript_4098/m.2375 type:complete len:87 (+) Transcript_4098:483-743(+)
MRDYDTRNNPNVLEHETGTICEDPTCKSPLCDNIINFGETLNERVINAGYEHSNQADLCITMGSSLLVTPAATMAADVGHQGIVNL